jgi:hypothetical protein
VAFGAPVPKSAGGLALSCLLAIGGLFAFGLLIAALAPTVSLRVVDLASRRLGNYQYNPVWGFLADQSWVR